MHILKSLPGTLLILGGVTAIAFAGHGASSRFLSSQPQAELALRQLQADFHGAATLGDYELMRSLWAEDAVVFAGGGMHVGPDAIADFFSSTPNWGKIASLSPTYNNTFEVQGNTATLRFECILVNTGDLDPVTTSLSTIPFGGQNPQVQIVQHSTATCVAVLRGDEWVFQMFTGSAGPPS